MIQHSHKSLLLFHLNINLALSHIHGDNNELDQAKFFLNRCWQLYEIGWY